MSSAVAERIRLVILTDDEVRAALRLEAARRGIEQSECADAILREALVDALREVRERDKKDHGKGKK